MKSRSRLTKFSVARFANAAPAITTKLNVEIGNLDQIDVNPGDSIVTSLILPIHALHIELSAEALTKSGSRRDNLIRCLHNFDPNDRVTLGFPLFP